MLINTTKMAAVLAIVGVVALVGGVGAVVATGSMPALSMDNGGHMGGAMMGGMHNGYHTQCQNATMPAYMASNGGGACNCTAYQNGQASPSG